MREKLSEIFSGARRKKEKERKEEEKKEIFHNLEVAQNFRKEIERIGSNIKEWNLRAFLQDDCDEALEELKKKREEFIKQHGEKIAPIIDEIYQKKQSEINKLRPSDEEVYRTRRKKIEELSETEKERYNLEGWAIQLIQRKREAQEKLEGIDREVVLEDIAEVRKELEKRLIEIKNPEVRKLRGEIREIRREMEER